MSNNGDLLDEGLQAVMGKDRCQNDGYVIFGDPKKKTTTEQRKATLDMTTTKRCSSRSLRKSKKSSLS